MGGASVGGVIGWVGLVWRGDWVGGANVGGVTGWVGLVWEG